MLSSSLTQNKIVLSKWYDYTYLHLAGETVNKEQSVGTIRFASRPEKATTRWKSKEGGKFPFVADHELG